MALGSLSANGKNWVPVLFKVLCETSGTELTSLWVGFGLSIEMANFGKVFVNQYSMESGVLWWTEALDLGLPPLGDTPVRGFPAVLKLLLIFDSLPLKGFHPWLICLTFCLIYFVLPPFKENGLSFQVPGVSSASIQKLFCPGNVIPNLLFLVINGAWIHQSSETVANKETILNQLPPPPYLSTESK